MRSTLWCLGLLVFAADAVAADSLFHIKRNKNRNEFHYEALVHECRWADTQIRDQWHMFEKGEDVREGMRWLEKPAYGHKTRAISPTQIEVTMNAKKDLPVLVELVEADGRCAMTATTQINEQTDARLRFVYVCARERRLWRPQVQYIDVHGFDDAGYPIVERFAKTDWARALGEAAPLAENALPPLGDPLCGHGEERSASDEMPD
jgi:hypothetical protein